ncbi:MAG TPA: hypothetical protein VEJ63_03575 [Planctomycetota bacterium]|nr:hypothetical protein [Planctomycetota bacterium]
MPHARTYFTLDIVVASALVAAAMLALAWGKIRHEEEQDRVRATLSTIRLLKTPAEAVAEKDGWGRPLLFDDTSRTVISLGADGLPGGDGYNADLRVGPGTSSSETR